MRDRGVQVQEQLPRGGGVARAVLRGGGRGGGVISDCRFAVQLNHVIPYLLND